MLTSAVLRTRTSASSSLLVGSGSSVVVVALAVLVRVVSLASTRARIVIVALPPRTIEPRVQLTEVSQLPWVGLTETWS